MSIYIPKKINVGYQNRLDTYTGKLAYVIYFDEKGKLRKEASWQSWRNKDIPSNVFDNIPTEGFVLNKKVGDYSSGWDHRKSYCRVYDPRGFEFEISIENLLYILENTTSTKGKGLEGEFVYGWSGKDLILIPIESPDYKSIVQYSDIINNNECIKAKDLIIGATYLDKNNEQFVYICDDGTLQIYDHKSSSMYTAQGIEEHSRQLLTYLLGKEQEGYKVSKIAWHFMKYVDIQFIGKKTIKSKEKTLLTKTIERRKIGSEMAKYVESDLIDAGIDEVECDIFLNEFINTNKFDCLPENIRSKYVMKPCIIEYEITEEAKENCKKYITDTIKKWEFLKDKDEKNFPPRSFTKLKKNGEAARDDFYCNNLCGHKRTCPHYQDYLATLDTNEDDFDLF